MTTLNSVAKETSVRINELNYAYKLWGEPDSKPVIAPVIALHGWLDNAASFDVLAAKLAGLQLAALDMAGHGLSDFRHAQGAYNIWDDLVDILALADHLGWQKFTLLGHSRGAIISMLLASTMPDRVENLIMLDAVSPLAIDPGDAPKQLASYINDQRRAHRRSMPVYASREDALNARCKPSLSSLGMPIEAAQYILSRGLKETGQGFQWRSDPRLALASAFKMSNEHNKAFLDNLQVPVLACLAKQGFGALTNVINELEKMSTFEVKLFDGSHHFHLEQEPSDKLAQCIKEFLDIND